MPLRPRVFLLLTVAAALAAPWICSSGAWADPLPGSAFESTVGRFLLGETPSGIARMSLELGRTATAADIDEYLTRLRARDPIAYADLESRLARVRESLNEAQSARNGGESVPESDRFSSEERLFLREAASQEIGEESLDGASSKIASPENFNSTSDQFLAADTQDTPIRLEAEKGDTAPAETQARAKRTFKEWYKDAEECRMNRPRSATRAMNVRNLLEQEAITALNTTIGTVARVGFSKVQWSHLSIDLLSSLISTGVSMSWMSNLDTLQVRWLKVFTWGYLNSNVDMEIYRVSPWTDTGGLPLDEAAHERREFNYAWNADTSWVNPMMFVLINGTECLLREEKGAEAAASFARKAFVVKTARSIGTSILFQRLRGNHVRAERMP